VRSRAPALGRAPEVTVEVHLASGLPSFSIVGLPDLEVRESRERVRAALQNCSFDFPVRRIMINLAPADLPKESGRFDLPIALGILAASGQIPVEALLHREFAGEPQGIIQQRRFQSPKELLDRLLLRHPRAHFIGSHQVHALKPTLYHLYLYRPYPWLLRTPETPELLTCLRGTTPRGDLS